MKVGFLHSLIRKDEKLLLSELRGRHDVTKVDVRDVGFDIIGPPKHLDGIDIAIDRCIATSQSLYVTKFCEAYGIPVINQPSVVETCADKIKTSLALKNAGVPTPDTKVAFAVEKALEVIDDFGYPCVLKPVTGSWGRLMAKIESRTAAEAVLEHKSTLGHYEHSIFYIQEYVDKPNRDIRVLATDGVPIAAMTRSSDHWITNAAKEGQTSAFGVDAEVKSLVESASDAVGGGLLGIDLMEVGDGYTVHEVNHSVEFKALNETTEVDVPGKIVDWIETKRRSFETSSKEVLPQ